MAKALLIGINSKYIHPSIGIFQLYTNSKYDCLYKEFTIKDKVDSIASFINNDDSNICGISTYIWNIEIVKALIPLINNKILFLGGPEASYNLSLLSEKVPYIIKGEGEESFNELMDFLEEKRDITAVSNLYYLENNEIKYTFFKNPDLTKVKHDMSLIKDFTNRICYLESSRGCYFTCSYCLASTEKPVRFFPLTEVKANLLYLLEHNAKIIKFLDRSFNIDKTYTKEILSFIRDHDNGVSTFQFEIVGDNLDQETIAIINSLRPKMIRFEIGIQTTNPIVTKEIKRIQNFDRLKENIGKIKDNVVIHTDLIAGLPLETFISFRKSFNDTFLLFTEELQLGFLKELKGTVISATKQKYGYKFMDISPYEVIENDYITNEELQIIHKVEESLDRFYNRQEFPRLMKYLFLELQLNPFDTFLHITEEILKKGKLSSFQFAELTNLLYESLTSLVKDADYLLYTIKKDYLTSKKIKPKIFWQNTITRETRKEVYSVLSKEYNINIDDLYNYAHVENYRNQYFIHNYKNHTSYEISLRK